MLPSCKAGAARKLAKPAKLIYTSAVLRRCVGRFYAMLQRRVGGAVPCCAVCTPLMRLTPASPPLPGCRADGPG